MPRRETARPSFRSGCRARRTDSRARRRLRANSLLHLPACRGGRRRSRRVGLWGRHIGVHILDDPMAGYGDHEVGDDPLQILRHSTAHLLAAAVTELYPGVKYAIGPAIKEPPGFYYDFDFGKQVSDAELPAIESRMRRLANADI